MEWLGGGVFVLTSPRGVAKVLVGVLGILQAKLIQGAAGISARARLSTYLFDALKRLNHIDLC